MLTNTNRLYRRGVALLVLLLATGCSARHGVVHGQQAAPPATSGMQEMDPRAVDLVIRGSVAELLGDYRAALLAYQEAQIYAPNSPSLLLAIAQNYQRLHNFDSALNVLKQAEKLDPQNVEVLQNLALLHEVQQDNKAAMAVYERLVALQPLEPDVRYRLGTIYLREQQNDKAIDQFESIVKYGFATPDVWRPLGLLYLEAKQYDAALETFQSWIAEYPEDEQAYLDAGQVYQARDQLDSLTAWYREVLQEHSDFNAVRAALQEIYLAQERLDEAVALYEQAFAIDSTDLATIGQLGYLYMQAGDSVRARDMFERFRDARPDDWRSYYNLGQLSYLNARWQETARFLQKATELNDKLPNIWLMLGETYFRIDSLALAEQAVRRAYQLVPDSKDANYMLGLVLYQQQRSKEAIPYFEATLKIDSLDVRAMGILASIYSDLERYARSDSLYEQALRISPGDPIFSNNYSYSLAVRGVRLDYARELVTTALAAEPDNGAYLDTKGWVLYQQGDYQGALEYIQKSIDIRDTSAEVWEHLGDVYEKLGQYEEAIKAWRKAYELDESRETVIEKLDRQKQ